MHGICFRFQQRCIGRQHSVSSHTAFHSVVRFTRPELHAPTSPPRSDFIRKELGEFKFEWVPEVTSLECIVLFTNQLAMRDLEVLVPPKFMIFRRASFQTGTRMHTYLFFLQFWYRTGVGTGLGLGWGSVWVGLYNYFKAAICLILASNTPCPLPPRRPPAWGGGVGYLRQGLSKLLP